MYYSIHNNRLANICLKYSALIILFLSLIANPKIIFADIKITTAEEYRVEGNQQRDKGNFDKALQYYKKSLELDPDNEFVQDDLIVLSKEFRNHAYQEQQKGNIESALNYYVEAIELDPDNATIRNDMGVLYEQLGILDKAEDFYLKAIELDEQYLAPYMNLAYLYQTQGNITKAIEYFEKRYKLSSPHDPWGEKARLELFKLDPNYQTRLIDQQLEKLSQELVEKERQEFYQQIVRSDNHYIQGIDYMAEELYDDAIDEFDKALMLTPRNPKVIRARERAVADQLKQEITKRSQKALKLLNSGEPNSAKEEFRRILTIIPEESN